LVEKQVVTMFFDLYFVLPEQIISKAFLTLVWIFLNFLKFIFF